ncbi:ClpS-like protein [Peniophora sp. CONT]|nr:ClpS-like protein [Peniophora sp. CONT]
MASRSMSLVRAAARARPATSRPAFRSLATTSRVASDAAAPAAAADPKLSKMVDDIAGLTLLQAADLVTLLKTRLNIQEIAMPSAAPAAAPAAVEEAAVEEKPKEKTIFNVKLESFDAAAKPKIIKEVKALVPNLTLMDAKKFVESLPQTLKENMPKEDAEKLKAVFEKLGGIVKLE